MNKMVCSHLKIVFFCFVLNIFSTYASIPIIINTWNYSEANQQGWSALTENSASAVDAVTVAGTTCEDIQCGFAVGFGGCPDETGETTLDSQIFDGSTMDMGAVGDLRRIKNAIKVAKHVLENTKHSLIVGDSATQFAVDNFKFKEESLATDYSSGLWEEWQNETCQPNFWKNVKPDPTTSCGPYEEETKFVNKLNKNKEPISHDTIGIIAIDKNGNVAAGTTTNGLIHKIPGRVGDSPIPGAGAYADNEVGAAVATGDGDTMMRFLPTFLAVEHMRNGASPSEAASIAVERIKTKYPDFFGAVVVCNKDGAYGVACNGMSSFPFCVANSDTLETSCTSVMCG